MLRTRLHGLICPLVMAALATPGQAFAPPKSGGNAAAAPTALPVGRPVDINSASLAELKTLPGIGDAEAARIVAARPYPSKAKLVADNVIGMALFTQLKDRIEARQQLPAKKTPTARPSP